MFIISIIASTALTFAAFFVGAKISRFTIYNKHLLIVALASSTLGLIPKIGFFAAIISTYLLLKTFSKSDGIILMMLISLISSVAILAMINNSHIHVTL